MANAVFQGCSSPGPCLQSSVTCHDGKWNRNSVESVKKEPSLHGGKIAKSEGPATVKKVSLRAMGNKQIESQLEMSCMIL